MNLGSYSNLPMSAARQTAKELRLKVTLGHDVAGEKQERKTVALAKIEAAQTVMTVAKLADEYFERMVLGKWRHPNIVRSRIEGDIKLNIGKLALENVEPRHIDAMLQTVVKRGAPVDAKSHRQRRAALGAPDVRLRHQAPHGALQPGGGVRPLGRRRQGGRPRPGTVP